jgi:uncharacterized protein
MTDTSQFVQSLGGGLMLGLAATLYIGLCGRILGISDVIGRVLAFKIGMDSLGALCLLTGLAIAPAVFNGFAPVRFAPELPSSPLRLICAGLLTGFGAAYGSGCTSGHGICGFARLSKRSIVATCIFVVTAMIVTTVDHHWIGD